jgi:hypothetical protein
LSLAALTQLFDLQIRTGNATDKVIDSFGNITDAQIINPKEFGQHLTSSVSIAKSYVTDTVLNRIIRAPRTQSYFLDNQGDYRKLLYDKVKKGELTFQRVEVIFTKENLEAIIFRLFLHEGCRYYIRHYDSPPQPIPIMNFMSFDGKELYLGGFYNKEAAGEEKVLFINERHSSDIYNSYWNVLWDGAIPLNESGKINLKELKRVGEKFGINDGAFRTMVNKTKARVEREKAQLNL